MKLLKKIIGNKYLFVLTFVCVWMIFFDENNIPQQIRRQHHLNELKQSENVLGKKIAETQKELSSLENDPAAIEKYAREKYLMKKPNEDLFIVEIVRDK